MAVSYDRLNSRVRDKFGETVEYTPTGGSARNIVAVVEQSYVSEVGGIGRQTKKVVFLVVDADVPELAIGDIFKRAGVIYQAVEILPDYNGMTDVLLNEV